MIGNKEKKGSSGFAVTNKANMSCKPFLARVSLIKNVIIVSKNTIFTLNPEEPKKREYI